MRSILIEGNTVVSATELDAIAAPYRDKELTAAEIERLRLDLTRHYVNLGYINSGVLLHTEGLRDGALRFQVIEGRLETIRINGLKKLVSGYVENRLSCGDEIFNLYTLQDRIQQLLNDPLIARLNAKIVPGTGLGKALLDVETAEGSRTQWSVFLNNYLPPSMGEVMAGFQGEVRNLTGWGDILMLGLNDSQGQTGISLDWRIPVTPKWLFSMGGDHGNASVVEKPLNDLNIDSNSWGWRLGIDYSPIQSLNQHLTLGLSYAQRGSRTTLLGEPFSFSPGAIDGRNRVEDWSLFQEYLRRLNQWMYVLRSTFTLGTSNTQELTEISNQPADNYWYWLGQGQTVFRLFGPGQWILCAVIQYATDHLVSLEQIALGGADTIRGYRENQLVHDRGWMTTLEYRYPLLGKGNEENSSLHLTLYPFIDYGVSLDKGQKQGETLSSAGFGVNFTFYGLEADLVLASRLREPPIIKSGSLQDNGVHFQIRYQF